MTDDTRDVLSSEDQLAFAAWEYARMGWRVLPVHSIRPDGTCTCQSSWMPPCASPGKEPIHSDWPNAATTDPNLIAQWWGAEHIGANIGVATGAGSGIWVLDVDEGVNRDGSFKVGLDSYFQLIADNEELPQTRVHRTGGGGSQYFFLVPDGFEIKSKTKGLGDRYPDIDLRGEGGQVVMPPSVSGKGPYTVEDAAEVQPTPGWLMQILLEEGSAKALVTTAPGTAQDHRDRNGQPVAVTQVDHTPAPGWLAASVESKLQTVRDAPDNQGNETINRMSYMIGQYIPNGWILREDAYERLMAAVQSWAHPHPSADYTIGRALDQGAQHPYQGLEAVAVSGDLSDAVMAERVCSELLAGQYCWAPGLDWLRWTGQVWEPSTDVEVTETVRQYVLQEVRATLPTVAGNSQARRSVTDLMSRSKINNMVQLARGIVLVNSRRFDSYADLINTPSGVVDLRDGTVRSHDPGLYFTKITKAEYRPDAVHPDWDAALEAVPPCCRHWFQVRIGQALTGYMAPDDILVLLQGTGENGKALDVRTPMLTANRGWTFMGDLQVGDEVFGPDGQPSKILGAYDTMTGHDCYRVTLTDGRSLVADADHLWTVKLHSGTSKLNRPRWVTMTTKEMLDRGVVVRTRGTTAEYRFHMPEQASIDIPDIDLPLDPYVLGAWLGDGASAGSVFTCHPNDAQVIEEIRRAGFIVRHMDGKNRWAISGGKRGPRAGRLSTHLRDLGLINNKHVPEQYLTAGTGQRLALLQGLMDTDGFASAGQGQAEFCTTTPALADAVAFLVRSLGWVCSVKEGRATLNGRDCGIKYRILWTPGPDGMIPFRLERKAERIRQSKVRTMHRRPSVKSIEKVESRPVRCIMVDREDSLYLAGRELVPTHNTTVLSAIMAAIGEESFAVDVPKQVLVGKSDDPHALMPFRGARMAVIEELPEGRRLSATRIKETVGTPNMTGRHMYKNLVTWRATHSLFLTTNYIPSVAETDHGTWRRLLMMKFPYRFVKPGVPLTRPNDKRGDPRLRLRLISGQEQAVAVLAWAVRGAMEWYQADRVMPDVPDEIQADTDQWRSESDLILAYWRDRLEPDPNSWIMSDDLYMDFRLWLGQKGHPNAWSSTLISSRFETHDETMAAHLIKVQPLVDEKVSRPGGAGASEHLGKQRRGWAGVCFRTL